nr:MAG TPA: hypothetical protein [Caudoviricetes sp.]
MLNLLSPSRAKASSAVKQYSAQKVIKAFGSLYLSLCF